MKAYSKSGDGERKTKKLRPSVKLRRLLKLRSRLPRVPAKVDSHEGVDRVYMDFSDQEPHPPDGVIHVASCSPAVLSDGTAKFIAACLNDIDAVEGVLDENAKLREAVAFGYSHWVSAPKCVPWSMKTAPATNSGWRNLCRRTRWKSVRYAGRCMILGRLISTWKRENPPMRDAGTRKDTS